MSSKDQRKCNLNAMDDTIKALYKQSQTDQAPEHLDQLILKEAQDAVVQSSANDTLKSPHKMRPYADLHRLLSALLNAPAIAATLVLGMIALLITQPFAPTDSTIMRSESSMAAREASAPPNAYERSSTEQPAMSAAADADIPALQLKERAAKKSSVSTNSLTSDQMASSPALSDQAESASRASAVNINKADNPDIIKKALTHIRDLIAKGETDQARRTLEAFIEQYPNQPLPQDIKQWKIEFNSSVDSEKRL